VQILHRSRELLIRQRTQLGNALRAHLAELGMIFPQGLGGLSQAIRATRKQLDDDCPALARKVLVRLADQIAVLRDEISALDEQLASWHRSNEDSQRLATIPGIGVITASAILAAIGDGKQFKSGREFAAWIGLVPRQNSSGGKDRLGRISKQGNQYLRTLLVLGATTQLRNGIRAKAPGGMWFDQLLKRRPARVASIALANKMARVAWAVLTRGERYDAGRTKSAAMIAAVAA